MDINKVHPELRQAIGRIPSIPFNNRICLWILNLSARFISNSSTVDSVSIETIQLEHASVRIYRPEGALSGAGLLWIHGGGYITGTAAMNDRECALYADNLKLLVVSVDYRLAPKHPFPAAIDDCFEAWQWLQQSAVTLGIDPARIAVSGQSAGGGLAACLVQRIHDTGETKVAAQALFCPMLDDRTAAREELDAIKHRIWSNKNNRGGWAWYLDQKPGEKQLPPYAAAARREDLAGLPPSWVGVGDIDLFYEEDRNYAQRLNDSGVSCDFYAAPMAPHGFEALVPNASVSRDIFASNYAFLTKALNL